MWKQRLENSTFLGSTWLRHQSRDAYWQHGSVCENYEAIQAAVLSVGGWHDGYRNTISHLVSNVSAPVKGIVGPWIHKYPHYAAPQPAIGFLQESLRWWDRWLKQIDTGVETDADYRVWLMDSVKPARWLDERPGQWVGAAQWPWQQITKVRRYAACDTPGNLRMCEAEGNCKFEVQSPQHCGQTTGEYFPFTYGPELPDNQLADDDVSVCIDSELLESDLAIVGSPDVTVTLSANKPTGLLVLRLCDLRPDGTSALITSGMLNLQHRNSFEFPQKLTPGETFTVELSLDQIAYRVPAGHRLRLAVSTSYWPFIWPSVDNTTLLNVSHLGIEPADSATHT